MSDTMLLGVLRMPPSLWNGSPLDVAQRHSRYIEAANRIEAFGDSEVASFPDGTTEADVRVLREANLSLAVESHRFRTALQDIAAMTYDSWTNGAKAGQIADAALATDDPLQRMADDAAGLGLGY